MPNVANFVFSHPAIVALFFLRHGARTDHAVSDAQYCFCRRVELVTLPHDDRLLQNRCYSAQFIGCWAISCITVCDAKAVCFSMSCHTLEGYSPDNAAVLQKHSSEGRDGSRSCQGMVKTARGLFLERLLKTSSAKQILSSCMLQDDLAPLYAFFLFGVVAAMSVAAAAWGSSVS